DPLAARGGDQLDAGHLRHLLVGDQDVDLPLPEDGERLGAGGGDPHRVPALQHLLEHLQHRGLVVDAEDGVALIGGASHRGAEESSGGFLERRRARRPGSRAGPAPARGWAGPAAARRPALAGRTPAKAPAPPTPGRPAARRSPAPRATRRAIRPPPPWRPGRTRPSPPSSG